MMVSDGGLTVAVTDSKKSRPQASDRGDCLPLIHKSAPEQVLPRRCRGPLGRNWILAKPPQLFQAPKASLVYPSPSAFSESRGLQEGECAKVSLDVRWCQISQGFPVISGIFHQAANGQWCSHMQPMPWRKLRWIEYFQWWSHSSSPRYLLIWSHSCAMAGKDIYIHEMKVPKLYRYQWANSQNQQANHLLPLRISARFI